MDDETPTYIRKPGSFDPAQHQEINPLRVEAVLVCDFILNRIARWGKFDKKFVNVSRKDLKEWIPWRKVTEVRDFLISLGIIECDWTYQKGKYSMGYRMGVPHRKTIDRFQVENPITAQKIRSKRITVKSIPVKPSNLPPPEKFLYESLEKVKISVDGVEAVIEQRASERDEEISKKVGKDFFSESYRSILKMTVDQIHERQFDFRVCRYGRCHTPVTRIFSEARKLLFFERFGALANIDISNSQPLFSLTILHPDILHTRNRSPLVTHYESPICDPEMRFCDLVLSGDLYHYLADIFNDGMPPEKKITNRKVKQVFFKDALFGETAKKWIANTRLAKIFRDQFPKTWDAIQREKVWDGTVEKKDAFKKFARKLQRVESDFMIRTVIPRVKAEFPGVPVLTVHDSIMCPFDYAEKIKKIMEEEFFKIGLRAMIRVER